MPSALEQVSHCRRNHSVRTFREWLTGGEVHSIVPLTKRCWDRLIDDTAKSGILPALQHRAVQPQLSALIPEEVANLLGTIHALNTERNRIALAQAQELAAALNQIGVQPIALKGLAQILEGVYPSTGCRYLADIDVLVSAEQAPAALGIFRKLGYICSPVHSVELSVGHSYPPFRRTQSLEIDLHRTLGLGICSSLLPAADVIGSATVRNINGASILVPSPNHLVVHHIIHSQLHDSYRERINPSFRTLYDFFLLRRHFDNEGNGSGSPTEKPELDWGGIESHFRRNGHYATFALYLLAAEDALGIPPPVPLHLTPLMRIRRYRRKLLQRWRVLRFVDPFYYWFAGVKPRTRRLHDILSQPAGLRYLLQKFRSPAFYNRLRNDFR